MRESRLRRVEIKIYTFCIITQYFNNNTPPVLVVPRSGDLKQALAFAGRSGCSRRCRQCAPSKGVTQRPAGGRMDCPESQQFRGRPSGSKFSGGASKPISIAYACRGVGLWPARPESGWVAVAPWPLGFFGKTRTACFWVGVVFRLTIGGVQVVSAGCQRFWWHRRGERC